MRTFTSRAFAILWLFALAASTISCAPTLLDRVNAMVEAHNSHDVDKELYYYTDDARFQTVGKWTKDGKEQIRQLLEKDALLNSHLTYTFCRESADTVTCRVREENDMLRAAGIDAIYYDSAVHTFEGLYITEIRVKQSAESEQALEQASASFNRWASQKYGEALAQLSGSGGNISKENVAQWLALMRRWYQETGQQE